MNTSLIIGIIISVIILVAGVTFGAMTLTSLPKPPPPLKVKFNTVPPPVLSSSKN